MKRVILMLILSATATAVAAQSSSSQEPPMKKFDWWVGEWKGKGWQEYVPGRRDDFTITETVQSKLGGMVLLIEGIGKEGDRTIHHALAILSYDPQSKGYRMRSYLANGRSGDFDVKAANRGFEWGTQHPQGSIRYTMKLTEKGEWFEIGERSSDGKTWQRFHEMTLQRVE